MSFFKKLGKNVNKLGKDVATKTKNIAEITRLNSENNHTQRIIEDLYAQIGQKEYALFLKDEGDEKFSEDFAKIKAAFDSIEENERRALELKDLIICSNCGAKQDIENEFCGKCGTKFQRPVKAKEETDLKE